MNIQELPGLILIQRLSPPFGVSSRHSSNQRTDKKVQEAFDGHQSNKELSNGIKVHVKRTVVRKDPFHELLVERSFETNRKRHFSFIRLPFYLAFHCFGFLSAAISFSCRSKKRLSGYKINS
jgi:hypothetical protein